MYLTPGERVFAVILNFNTADQTYRCVEALRTSTHPNLFSVVVDNGSSDADRANLKRSLGPAAVIIETGENLGYAAGNNLGMRWAIGHDADYLWVLNPDTEPTGDALTEMLAVARRDRDVGAVGSVNVRGSKSNPVIHFAGGRMDWESGVPESIHMGSALAAIDASERYGVDYVAGSSMLLRPRALEEIGFIPEEYFLYFEETDMCRRLNDAGWSTVVAPRSVVWHHYRSGSGLPKPYYIYYYVRGRLLFADRYSIGDVASRRQGLDTFIDGWRSRVETECPGWLDSYDRLVALAVDDGMNGITGRREEISSFPEAGAEEDCR